MNFFRKKNEEALKKTRRLINPAEKYQIPADYKVPGMVLSDRERELINRRNSNAGIKFPPLNSLNSERSGSGSIFRENFWKLKFQLKSISKNRIFFSFYECH